MSAFDRAWSLSRAWNLEKPSTPLVGRNSSHWVRLSMANRQEEASLLHMKRHDGASSREARKATRETRAWVARKSAMQIVPSTVSIVNSRVASGGILIKHGFSSEGERHE